MNELEATRRQKDEFFRRSADSPLTAEQRASFTGLRYFDADPRYRFEPTLERADPAAPEEVQTSDGQVRLLPRAGTLRFAVGGQTISLVAYDQGDALSIPFRDATSGMETYGAGRYIEAHPLGGDRYDLDLNAAYNPYCAYNANWSCPLPPRSNWLDVAIRAGEKVFPDAGALEAD